MPGLPSTSHPESSAEVSALVAQALAESIQLRIRDSGSFEADAEPGQAGDGVTNVVLDRMNSVVDYPARDMTVTVEAGMTCGRLQPLLAEEGQQLPIDASNADMSIGGLVACDIAGPRQYGYGTLRDYVIGIEAVDGTGRIFHAGGRVVKNVAGYDLCRLLVGSRGALGIITQITFKLRPQPASSAVAEFRFADSASIADALENLNTSQAAPVLIDIRYDASGTTSALQRRLSIGVDGTPDACDWQLCQIESECQSAAVPGSRTTVQNYLRSPNHADAQIQVQCLPSQVIPIAETLAETGISTFGHAGNGILYATGSNGDEPSAELVRKLTEPFSALVIDPRTNHPGHTDDAITRKLRTALDPHHVFSFGPDRMHQ